MRNTPGMPRADKYGARVRDVERLRLHLDVSAPLITTTAGGTFTHLVLHGP